MLSYKQQMQKLHEMMIELKCLEVELRHLNEETDALLKTMSTSRKDD